MRHGRALLVLVIVLSLAAACSDDDNPSGSDDTTPSTAALSLPPAPTDESTTTTIDVSAIEASPEFCTAAQTLIALDAQTTPLMTTVLAAADGPDSSTDPTGVEDTAVVAAIAQLEALAPQIVDAYDALAGNAPTELASDVADFRAGSLAVLDALRDAAQSGDVEGAMGSIDPEVSQRAVDGAERISAVTEDDCGFSLTN
jgi:hypothetical protein